MNISITLGVPGKQETLQKGFAHGLGSISQTPGKNLPDTVKTIVPHHFEKTGNHHPRLGVLRKPYATPMKMFTQSKFRNQVMKHSEILCIRACENCCALSENTDGQCVWWFL